MTAAVPTPQPARAKTGLHSSTALELVQYADRPVLIVPH
jgi:hypothetical protein